MPGAVQTVFEFVPPDERIRKKELQILLEKQRMTLRGVAGPLEIDHRFLWSLAKKYKLKKRRRHVAKFFVEEIVAAKISGKSANEIAEALGCSRRRVLAVVQKFFKSQASQEIGSSDLPELVKPYRCPRHGIVKFRPCVACLAESSDNGTG